MDPFPQPLKACLQALQKLPGVGPKSAQRILFHLLEAGPGSVAELAGALERLGRDVASCPRCRVFTEASTPCPFCDDASRDRRVLCVVETPADVYLIEATGEFRGGYHVLRGLLSPIRGIRPEHLGLDLLEGRCAGGEVEEVILATPPTAEGEATAAYLGGLIAPHGPRVTRIAYGLPVGADFQYVDAQTLSRALSGRRALG